MIRRHSATALVAGKGAHTSEDLTNCLKIYLSLSRFKQGLPRGADEPGMREGTAEVPHPSAAAHLPEAASVFDAATAFDTALDMVAP